MVRLSANSIRVVADAEEEGFDATPAENVNEPDHVGAWLREAREATGRDLRDVAAHLRIRYPYLLAIEEGRFDDLPGRAYAVGFIRSYAGHLGLDAEAMVERYKRDVDAIAIEQNLKFPTPAPEGRFPGRTALLASAVLVAAAVGGWYYYQNRAAVDLDRVPPPPESSAPVAAAPPAVAPATSDATPSGDVTTGETSAGEASTDSQASVDAPAITEPVANTAAAPTPINEPTPVVEPAPEPSATAAVDSGLPSPETAGPESVPSEPAPSTPAATPPEIAAPATPEPWMTPEPAMTDSTMTEPAATEAAVSEAAPPAPTTASPAATETVETAPVAPQTAASEPASPAPVAVEPTPAPAVSTTEPAPQPADVAEEPVATEPETTEPETQVAALPAPPAVEPVGEPQGRVYGLTNRDARVVLTARGESWVQVRDAAQAVLFTRTLQPGESYRVPNRQGLLMRVGNPRMLDISIDGSAPVQLSDSDRPIQDVTLDPQVLRDAISVR